MTSAEQALELALGGSLGFFWESPRALRADVEPERGYIRRLDRSIEVEALMEEVGEDSRLVPPLPPAPSALVGALTSGGVLVPEPTWGRRTRNFGGGRASIRTYRAKSLVTHIHDLHHLRDDRANSLSIRFPGLLEWAGLSAESIEMTHGPDKRVRQVKLTLDSPDDPPSARLGGGRMLRVTTHWRTKGSTEQRSLGTALEIACTSNKPATFSALSEPFEPLQALVSMAHNGWQLAQPGSAVLNARSASSPFPAPKAGYWHGPTMTTPTGVEASERLNSPFFNLHDIGGARGMARWVTLTNEHPRATWPVASLYRKSGLSHAEVLTLVCQASEYWVSANKRT